MIVNEINEVKACRFCDSMSLSGMKQNGKISWYFRHFA